MKFDKYQYLIEQKKIGAKANYDYAHLGLPSDEEQILLDEIEGDSEQIIIDKELQIDPHTYLEIELKYKELIQIIDMAGGYCLLQQICDYYRQEKTGFRHIKNMEEYKIIGTDQFTNHKYVYLKIYALRYLRKENFNKGLLTRPSDPIIKTSIYKMEYFLDFYKKTGVKNEARLLSQNFDISVKDENKKQFLKELKMLADRTRIYLYNIPTEHIILEELIEHKPKVTFVAVDLDRADYWFREKLIQISKMLSLLGTEVPEGIESGEQYFRQYANNITFDFIVLTKNVDRVEVIKRNIETAIRNNNNHIEKVKKLISRRAKKKEIEETFRYIHFGLESYKAINLDIERKYLRYSTQNVQHFKPQDINRLLQLQEQLQKPKEGQVISIKNEKDKGNEEKNNEKKMNNEEQKVKKDNIFEDAVLVQIKDIFIEQFENQYQDILNDEYSDVTEEMKTDTILCKVLQEIVDKKEHEAFLKRLKKKINPTDYTLYMLLRSTEQR